MAEHLYWKLQAVADENSDFSLFREKYGRVYDENGLIKEYKSDEELKGLFEQLAYKNPLFSKIYSLTTGYVVNGQIRIKYQIGEEKDLIQTFLNLINNPFFSQHTLVHLDAGVLLPYFGVRATLNGLKVNHKGLQYLGKRPWDLQGISLRDYFQGAGDYNFNLKEIAYINGIEADFIEYKDEYMVYKNGGYQELMDSAKNELVVMINSFRKSIGEDIVTEVEFSHERVEEVKPEGDFDPLKELVKTGEFTPEIKKSIQDKCRGKRLTKADKENLYTIIRGAWVRCDFINNDQDTKAKIQDKELEVQKFIDTL